MPHPYFTPGPMILAHRGASAYAPDHTLEALRLALDQGADAIEADVHLTRDGHAVLHHGGDVSENTEGSGKISSHTLSELQSFDAGYRFTPDSGITYPHRGKGHRVTTLAEALDAFPDARFNLDIKERRAAVVARRLIDEFGAHDRVLLASFYSWQRAPALRKYPGPRSITLDQMLGFMLLHWTRLDGLWGAGIDALQIPERYWGLRVVTPRLVERAHRLGMQVHVWTVDDEADMERLLGWGVDGIVTKRPDAAARVRVQIQHSNPGNLHPVPK
ncbi:MAG: glycerophosphodiester phosphodiesterase [Planctomycetota bacterium]